MGKQLILLADDDEAIGTVLRHALERAGFAVRTTNHFPELLGWVEDGDGDLVITDVVMPSGNGLDMLPKMKGLRPELPIIVISAQNTLMTAVKANALGAFDYLPKPFDLNDVIACVNKALAAHPPARTPSPAATATNEVRDDAHLIGTSPAIQDIYKSIARLVTNDLTVMIEGESGTGKELVARALHQLSNRKHKPFVAVNMAAIPKDLVESELFGHEKGAFTGAITRKTGKFTQADGGTLFLDEIGDMPLDAQTKLLRVLQQGEFTAIGSSQPIKTNVRIICATHRNLTTMVQENAFRSDLFYRLNVVPLRVPALRNRTEDIPALANHFLGKAHRKGLPLKQLSGAALDALCAYGWPGNVRELENMIYRIAALHSEAVIGVDAVHAELQTLPEAAAAQATHIAASAAAAPKPSEGLQAQINDHLSRYFASHQHSLPPDGLYERILEIVEKPLIEQTLRATAGNQLKAAKVLGINRNTLRKKMQQLGLMDAKRDLWRSAS